MTCRDRYHIPIAGNFRRLVPGHDVSWPYNAAAVRWLIAYLELLADFSGLAGMDLE